MKIMIMMLLFGGPVSGERVGTVSNTLLGSGFSSLDHGPDGGSVLLQCWVLSA